jgi:rhodanese-related sulfurtransferase
MELFLSRLPDFIQSNLMLVAIFVVLLVLLISSEFSRLTRKYKAITPGQLVQLINRQNALVIDVSPQADYQTGHIVGSRHVSMSQFDPESKDLAKVKELPITVVCKTGQTAAQACARLSKAGFTQVFWLEGGMQSWISADLPLAHGK